MSGAVSMTPQPTGLQTSLPKTPLPEGAFLCVLGNKHCSRLCCAMQSPHTVPPHSLATALSFDTSQPLGYTGPTEQTIFKKSPDHTAAPSFF